VTAVASAERGWPSSSAISPKMSPFPSTRNTASLPSTEGTLIFTVPDPIANRLLPGSPLANMFLLRFTDFATMHELRRSIVAD
jgi:hypothetical protein